LANIIFIFIFFFPNVEHSAPKVESIRGINSAQAQAVNDGIVYLMAVPYVLAAGIVMQCTE
jgi:hypothetical protein